jgi:hypothetical protein
LLPNGQYDADVEDISVRHNWGNLEPFEGVYDRGFLDNVVARAAAAGKAVLLRIGTGGGRESCDSLRSDSTDFALKLLNRSPATSAPHAEFRRMPGMQNTFSRFEQFDPLTSASSS